MGRAELDSSGANDNGVELELWYKISLIGCTPVDGPHSCLGRLICKRHFEGYSIFGVATAIRGGFGLRRLIVSHDNTVSIVGAFSSSGLKLSGKILFL
jgi:hypothetical protein